MFAVDAYGKDKATIPDDASSGGGRPLPITPYKGSLISLGITINFIYNWIKLFEENYYRIIMTYKEKMSEFFKTIPTSLPPKNLMIIKKYQTTIKAVDGT